MESKPQKITPQKTPLKTTNKKAMGEYLSLTEAAEFLNVHTLTLNRYCKKGLLAYYLIGPRKRFLKTDLINFIEGARCHAHARGEESTDTDIVNGNPFAAE
jgi:excisionase family DNA binding protein